jgi:thioredoxin reductase/bacterioferritin-associated ferredoxin
MNKAQLMVIGAGPAGLAAAQLASRSGVKVRLFDDNPGPGGQFLRQSTVESHSKEDSGHIQKYEKTRYRKLLEVIDHPNIEYHPDATIWGCFENQRIAYTQGEKSGSLNAENIILAAGAYDTAWPFPGWTLPGIITAGAALNLIKGQQIIPSGRTVVCGNGPLLLVAACYLCSMGADLVGVVQSTDRITSRRFSPGFLLQPANLLKALQYYSKLYRSGTRLLSGHTIVAATGGDRVEAALFAPLKPDGQPDLQKQWIESVDNIVISCGLAPSSELARGFGCETYYDAEKQYWCPVRDENMETSIPGVFSAGDCAGITGAKGSVLEGQLAGTAACRRIGVMSDQTFEKKSKKLKLKLRRHRKFTTALDRWFKSRHDPLSTITQETTICRCEDVTAGEIYQLTREGIDDLIRLKAESRSSMGRCQGRNCLRTIAHILSREAEMPIKNIKFPITRPPFKPVLIKDLLHERLAPPDEPSMKLP